MSDNGFTTGWSIKQTARIGKIVTTVRSKAAGGKKGTWAESAYGTLPLVNKTKRPSGWLTVYSLLGRRRFIETYVKLAYVINRTKTTALRARGNVSRRFTGGQRLNSARVMTIVRRKEGNANWKAR
jgi:hypothetical protein